MLHSFPAHSPCPRHAYDWNTLLWGLADRTATGKWVVILDEINWLGAKDATFPGKLKSAWDVYFSKNRKLILILSGSPSSWIEKIDPASSADANIHRVCLTREGFLFRELDLLFKDLFQKKQFYRRLIAAAAEKPLSAPTISFSTTPIGRRPPKGPAVVRSTI